MRQSRRVDTSASMARLRGVMRLVRKDAILRKGSSMVLLSRRARRAKVYCCRKRSAVEGGLPEAWPVSKSARARLLRPAQHHKSLPAVVSSSAVTGLVVLVAVIVVVWR